MTTDETRERPIPQWYNPQLKELLNDLYSRIERLETHIHWMERHDATARPSFLLPPPPRPRTRTLGELTENRGALPRSE